MAEGINLLTREGVHKICYNYLLLDPRKSQNLPAYKASGWGEQDLWITFISSIFYIGKGTRSRPLHHLSEALSKEKGGEETQRIQDIWKAGYGVVPLQVFNYSK